MADPSIIQAHQLAGQGAALAGRGDWAGAFEAYRQAVTIWPAFAEGHASMGSLLAAQGRHAEAVGCYGQALRHKPAFVECQYLLGHSLLILGQYAQAEACFRAAVRLMPGHVDALHGLGIACKALGRLEEALQFFAAAIALRPDFAEAHANRGATLELLGRLAEALACHEQALQFQPANAEMHLRRGTALAGLARFEEAAGAYRRALELRPGHFDALNNLGIALRMLGRLDEAVDAFRGAAAKPQDAMPWTNLGVLLDLKGERREALACHRRAVELDPGDAVNHSNLLYALHFHADISPQALLAEHRAWDRRHAAALRSAQPYANSRDPQRRLRVGYVSPDFRDHPVGRFMAPLIAAHDPAAVEAVCYADMLRDDAITADIRGHAHLWRDLRGRSDAEVAALVRQDGIDILIDLTMHMAGNRLLVFARQPAPVQATYLAYCATTGLSAMQYRLTDPHLDPPDSDVSCYSEESVRLPQYWCYAAPAAAPAVNALPAAAEGGVTGRVTFGCLNGFNKVSDEALAAWARVLLAAPGARLLLHANPGSHRQRVLAALAGMGVDAARCEFVGLGNLAEYFRTYQRIDIALDPFPYAGGTTTCDALWMGVPLVTLRSGRAVGRGGVSILSSLGIGEWIAGTTEEYVGIAARLAGDLAGLVRWRGELRGRMKGSKLMDAVGFARGVEGAYRGMWRRWCER